MARELHATAQTQAILRAGTIVGDILQLLEEAAHERD